MPYWGYCCIIICCWAIDIPCTEQNQGQRAAEQTFMQCQVFYLVYLTLFIVSTCTRYLPEGRGQPAFLAAPSCPEIPLPAVSHTLAAVQNPSLRVHGILNLHISKGGVALVRSEEMQPTRLRTFQRYRFFRIAFNRSSSCSEKAVVHQILFISYK